MKKHILWPLLLVGCAHVPQEVKTVNLPFSPELVEEMQQQMSKREVASVNVEELEGKSPRRVYFTALYHQFLALGHHLGEEVELASCPAFHHDKVETDDSVRPKFSLYTSKKMDKEAKEYFPELAFNKNFSLNDHFNGMKSEIATLCEEGLSDNFYKFDNLITHYAGKKSFHNRPDAMKSVLKIPVFANYYLLKMIQSPHTIASSFPEEKKLIELTQTHWFEKYVVKAHDVRNNLIKNKMVQR